MSAPYQLTPSEFDIITPLLGGISTALLSPLLAVTLRSGTFSADHLVYGGIDPQQETVSFPAVSYMDVTTVPHHNNPFMTVPVVSAVPGGGSGRTTTRIWRYLTLLQIDVWATNPADREILKGAVLSGVQNATSIDLPNGQSATVRFKSEMTRQGDALRHIYRSILTFECSHYAVASSTDPLVTTPVVRLT
jgi:hypothetical protein